MIHIPENMIKKYLLLLSKTVHYVLELAGLLSAWVGINVSIALWDEKENFSTQFDTTITLWICEKTRR